MGTITAQRVFDIAMGLMDEVNESSGATDTSDTREYKQRTLLILAAIMAELYPYSDTYAASEPGKRGVPTPVVNFTEPIDLDDTLAQGVAPYGLAARLLLDENPSAAGFFQQCYEELKQTLGKGVPAAFEPIENVYGGIEYGRFGRW